MTRFAHRAATAAQLRIGAIPFVLAIIYVVSAYASAAVATCTESDNIPYGYAFYFSCVDILALITYPISQALSLFAGFLIGNNLMRRRFKPILSIRVRGIRMYSNLAAPVSLILSFGLAAYFIFLAASHDNDNDIENWRAISSKSSQLLLVAAGFLTSNNIVRRQFSISATVLVFVISATVLVADASRSAALPLGIAAFFCAMNKRYILALLFSAPILPVLGLARGAREFMAFGESGFDNLASIIANTEFFSLGYLAAYSFVHMMVIQDVAHVSFTISDFLYSVIPLPSGIHFINHELENWRMDMFRPMSGMSQMLYLGFFPFLLFNIFIGIFFGKARNASRNRAGILGVLLLLIFFLSCHQYFLRGAMWFFYFHIIAMMISASSGTQLPSNDIGSEPAVPDHGILNNPNHGQN